MVKRKRDRPPSKQRGNAQKNKNLTLTREMAKTLKNSDWLSDDHIHLVQALLKKQFPFLDGLQSTLLCQNDGFIPIQSEGIQIHHVNGDHWVTSCSIGKEVTVYGSRFSGGNFNHSLTHQLALIYRSLIMMQEDGEDVDPHLVHVQQQNGMNDCGVYAIAFALHAALGDTLKDIEFDQPKMRAHLLQCFRKKELVRFPTVKRCGGRSKHFPYREIELFCTCLMPNTYGSMVQCDKCEQWYHIDCVGLSTFPGDTELWNCISCCAH